MKKMNTLPIGFHTAPYELYFKVEPDYTKLWPKFELLDSISVMSNMSICILDFYKHEYAYISKNHLFLCGYTLADTKLYGEKLAEKIIHEEDKINQAKMKDAACIFMSTLDRERIENLHLYTTHRLTHKNGTVFLVSNQYKPFMFDDNENMWLALNLTTMATKSHKIESYIEIEGFNERYVFSVRKNQFIKTESIKLSSKEHQVLGLTTRGFTTKEIADKINLSPNTIKFHKQKILDKLNVHNMSEACLYAFAHNLF